MFCNNFMHREAFKELKNINVEDKANWVPLQKVFPRILAFETIKVLKLHEKESFLSRCRDWRIEAITQILARIDIEDPVLKAVQSIHQSEIISGKLLLDAASVLQQYLPRIVDNCFAAKRLLCLRILKDKSGESHAAENLKALNECSVDPQKLVFQSYDFAICMSGKYKGCQRVLSDKIQEDFPHKKEILYIPCQAHRLSTFVERSSKASSLVSSMLDISQSLYTFFSSSTKQSEALEKT
eukprot:gene643-1311_t